MHTLEIAIDPEREKDMYRKYVRYERSRIFRKMSLIPILLMGLAISAIAYFFKLEFLIFFGWVFVIGAALFLLYYFIAFASYFNKLSRAIDEFAAGAAPVFTFAFDEHKITKTHSNESYTINWNAITDYVEDGNEIYVFTGKRQLFDIISATILGEELFHKYRLILQSKVKKKS